MRLKISHIRTKIVLAALVLVLFSVLASGFAIYIYVNNILSTQIVKDNNAIVTKLSEQLSYYLDDIKKYCLNIILNDQVQDYLKQKNKLSEYDYYSTVDKLINTLNDYRLLRDGIIDSIYVVDSDEKVLELNNLYSNTIYEEWYHDFSETGKNSGFSGLHYVENAIALHGKTKVVSYIQKIFDKEQADAYLGKIVINLKHDILVKAFESNNASIKSFLIYNENMNLIYQSDSIDKRTVEDIKITINGKAQSFKYGDKYLLIVRIPSNAWTVVGILPVQEIYKNLKYTNYVFFVIIVSCIIVMLLVIFPTVNSITMPLMTLVKGMKEVSSGKLDTEIEVNSGDEIEGLANVFNNMVKDIRKHIEELILKEKNEKEMKLRLFMSQINPHFIYNTLNTIIYLAREINANEIISVTKNLIRIMQNTIKTQPDELTTIQKEIEYINSYIAILKYRYNDLVEAIWHVEDGLSDNKIPRMLIYPLVENSVYHGILPKSGKGIIHIRISYDNCRIKIAVEDNGIGISEEGLEKLLKSINDNNSFEHLEHIGLKNVNHRLRLLYGEDYILNIQSEYGKGTNIWFYIPHCNG